MRFENAKKIKSKPHKLSLEEFGGMSYIVFYLISIQIQIYTLFVVILDCLFGVFKRVNTSLDRLWIY